MTEAVRQASLLEAALRKATTDKGISFYTLNQELVKAGTSAEQLVSTLGSAGPEFADSFNVALQALATADRSVISISSKFAEMRRVLTQSIKFTAAAQLQDAFVTAISECIRWVEDLNESLTMISVVTGKTASEMDGVYDSVIEGSKALRVAASDYAEASLIFYQQGLDDQEVQRRTDITIKAAQAAGSSTQEMSKQLTAVWNTFQMVGDEQERAASVGARLAADTAVDFKDIAEGMQISATAAAQMGVSYDSLAAIIATVGDTTQQSASVIGNAYKTIFSRFQQLKVEGTDGEVTLNRVSQQLQDVGIHVLDSAGNLRELDDVIMEVGMQWDNYSEKQQLAIAEVVGGTRQYGQFLALMQNFDKYVELLGTAQSEDGSALEQQYQAAQNSIEMAAVNAGEAWNRAFGEVIDEDLIKGFYNALEDVGNVVTDILDGMGGFEGILTLVGTLLARNIVPKLEQAVVAVKTMRANSTIEGRQAQVVASGQQMRQDIADQAESDISKASGRQKYQIQFNADSAGLKVDTWTAIGKAQQQINAMINSGNESLKIQGQYLSDQLKKYGEIGNQGAENLATARMELQEESQQTEELLEQIKLQQQLLAMNPEAVSEEAGDRIAEKEMTKSDNTLKIGDIDAQRAGIQAQIQSTLANTTLDATKVNEVINALRQQDTILADQRNSLVQINNEIDKEIANIREADQAAVAQEKQVTEIQKAFLEVAQAAAKARTSSEGAVSSSDINKMKRSMRDALTSNGFSLSNDGDKKIIGGIVKEFDGLANSGEIAASLEKIRAKVEAALGGKNISTEGYQNVIRALDQIDQAATGVSGITNNLSATLNQANIAAQKVSGSMTQIAFGFTGIATAASSGWSAALEGNFLGVASALGSIGMQLPQTIQAFKDLAMASKTVAVAQELTRIASDKAATSTLTQGVAYSALTAEQKKAYIQEQLLAMAKKLNIQGCEQMTAAQLKQAISQKGLTVSVSQTTGAVAANAAAWYAHPLTWILAAVMAVVAAFTIWNKIIEMNTEAAQKNVDNCQEEVDKYNELSAAITENTTAVEENIAAYQEAKATGQDVVKTYQDMVDSMTKLNDSLEEAGANSANLSQAMTNALATGDMTAYYEEVDKAQAQTYQNQMDSIEKLNQAQLKLAKSQMTKAFDFNGPEKTTVATTQYLEGGVVIEPSEAMKQLAETSELLENEYGNIELNLEFDNVTEFREQYQELVRIKEELEENGGKQSEISAIQEQIDGLTESYNALQESVNQATEAMSEMTLANIQNSGYDFSGTDLNGQISYIQQVYNYMKEQGQAIGMTNEEIENSFRGVIAQIPELNSALGSLDQVNTIMENVMSGDKNFSSSTAAAQQGLKDVSQEIESLQQVLNDAGEKSGIGTWFNGLSAEEEYIKETLNMTKEEALQKMEELKLDMAEKQREIQQEIQNTFNAMSVEDREMLMQVGVEFVDDKSDLQQMLDNIEGLNLKVNVEFKNEEELRSQFDEDQTTQDNMGTAISEYQENGFVTTDTAKEMIDNGLGEYLMVVGDQFVLTTGAAEAYNASIKRQTENVKELLGLTTELRAPTQEFATEMAAVRATMDNSVLEQYAQGLEDISVKFLNSEGSATDMIQYFNDLETTISQSIPEIQSQIDSLSDDQIRQVLSTFESLGTNLADTMSKANSAVAAGQMTIGEYRDALMAAGEAQRQASESALTIADDNLSDSIRDTNEALGLEGKAYIDNADGLRDYIKEKKAATKEGSQERKQLEETEALLNDAEDAYNGVKDSMEKYDKAMSDMEALEDFTDTVTENYEALQGILNEDFSLKFDMSDMDTSQLQVLEETVSSALTSIQNLSDEAAGNIADALMATTNGMNTMMINGTAYTRDSLLAALQNGQITAQDIMATGNAAATALLQSTAAENEAAITSASQAIGTLMSAVGDLISNFEAKLTVSISNSTLDLTPSWGGPLDLGWKLLKGEKVSIAPSGNLEFTIKGGLSGESGANFQSALDSAAAFFNSNDAGGMTDGIPNLGDYSTQTPTMAEPEDFDSEDGTGGNSGKKSGGSGNKFEPEELLDEDDIEKFVERYENITKAIERQTDALEDISGLMDDAYGARRLTLMDAYNKKIQQMAKNQKEYIKEAQKYYKEDKEALLNSNPAIKALVKFDPGNYGGISNPETIRRYLEDQARLAWETYNNEIEKYNNAGDASDAAKARLDKAKESYDQTIATLTHQNELLDQLLDTEETLQEAINDQVENIRNWMANKVEQATYKMELRIEINDFEIELMDQIKDAFGDIGLVGGQSLDLIHNQLGLINQDVDETISSVDRLYEIANNIASPENQEYFMDLFGSTEEGILAWKQYIGTGEIPQEVMDALNDSRDSLLDYYGQVLDYLDELWEGYITSINFYMDQVDNLIGRLESRADIADTFLDIIEKSGLDHKWGADKNSSQYKLMSTNMDNIASQAKALQTQFTIASEKAAEMKAELDDILQGRDPSQLSEEEAFIYNRVNEQYQELQKQANDLESQMYEAIATALDKAQEYAEAWGERIAHDWSEKLGGVFDDLSDAMDMYNQKQELSDFYMDDYDKMYELNKLQREIEDALEDTSDPERLEGYNSLLDQIEQKKQDGVKMTQTELEILQQQFQLEKDRDAYEDAQNAKNTMRLARDASGNWNYVYSNDSSANEEDSAQRIEDTLANIHRLHREAADEMGELWLQTYTDLYEYLQNVDWAMYEQDTKYKEMVDKKRQWYMEALDNYAKYFEYHNEAIGRNQSETTLGIIMNFDDLGDKNEWYKGEMDILVEELKDNYDDWMGKADQARQEISDDYTSLEEMVNDKTNDIIQENEDAADAVEQMARDTRDWLDKSAGYTQSWAKEVISYYDNVISKIKEYLALIQQSNKDALEADTGFNAQRDYTATIHNYAQDFINAGGTAEELMKDPTYLQMGKELANKIADSELNQSGHVVEDMAAMTDDGLGYLKEIAQNTKPDPDADRWDEFDESWQAAERGDAGSKLDPVYGTSVPKPTASGGLVKTPQVRSLAEEGPELVLNAEDTRNILSAVSQMREVVRLKMQGINGVLGRQTDNVTQKSVVNKDVQQIEQAVHIDATFPNVSVAAEIEEAFSNLVNQAVQYASAKKK